MNKVIETSVNLNEPHFEIRYGSFVDDEELITVAYIARQADTFCYEWSNEGELELEVIEKVEKNIHFFLREKYQNQTISSQEVWSYLRHHAEGTAANLYGMIHWVYIGAS